jgi:hypothetical protein
MDSEDIIEAVEDAARYAHWAEALESNANRMRQEADAMRQMANEATNEPIRNLRADYARHYDKLAEESTRQAQQWHARKDKCLRYVERERQWEAEQLARETEVLLEHNNSRSRL